MMAAMTDEAPPIERWGGRLRCARYASGLLALACTCQLPAQVTSVFFIGESYTAMNDLPATFQQLAFSLGDTVSVGMSAPGGLPLGMHTGYGPTLDGIASHPWDFVVLQEQSQSAALQVEGAGGPGSSFWWLCQLIEANNECTWPVLFMTWGWENGDALHCPLYPALCTYAGMQQNIREGCFQLNGLAQPGRIAPVGTAWQHVREDHPWIDLYQSDGDHPSPEGTYLAACVFYCTLFKLPCTGASFHANIPSATATILQEVATATVLDSMDTWSLNVPNGADAYWENMGLTDNSITLAHPGLGTHWWTCTNGQTSSNDTVTFDFETSGTYTVTHIYTDPCGNEVDTVSSPFDMIYAGIPPSVPSGPFQLWSSAPGMIDVSGGTGTEELWIGDLQGRNVATRRFGADHVRVDCPAGLYLWRILERSGARWTGKLHTP